MEIERKFLLLRPASSIEREAINAGTLVSRIEIAQRFVQGTGEWVQRTRQVTDHKGKVTHFLTQKRRVSDLSSVEIEIPIAAEFYHQFTDHCGPMLRKRRIGINAGGMLWEIDRFHNPELEGLEMAEVELTHEGQAISKPDWLGLDVTHDPAYRNFQIAKRLSI